MDREHLARRHRKAASASEKAAAAAAAAGVFCGRWSRARTGAWPAARAAWVIRISARAT